MIKKDLFLACFTVIILSATSGITTSARDHSTNPDKYFLKESESANSLYLLPPPPTENTARWEYDKEQYEWGKQQRTTPRGEQAIADANTSGPGIAEAFSKAFGIEINEENTPELFRLITGMREDAGDLATRHAKKYYMRPRPYIRFMENTSIPDEQQRLSTNGSYPSGHTSIGWATALVLAELNPLRQDEILKRGLEIGESRVICGFHFQSDVDAGRITGAAIVARLHADSNFRNQLEKAREEIARLISDGKIMPPSITS